MKETTGMLARKICLPGLEGMQALCLGMALLLLTGCCSPSSNQEETEPGRLRIVTTTGILKDAVEHIVGDRAEVVSLMGPGVDPHLYKATQGDVRKLSRADVIVYNGLHLEGKMGEVLKKLSRYKTVIAAAEGIPETRLRKLPALQESYDPHIWFDVELWKEAVLFLSRQIQERDPKNQDFYQTQAAAYAHELDSLDAWVKQEIASIPEQQRILITAHDAFGYFGDAYGMQVRGLQGISTVSDYGLRDVSSLVSYIVEHRIKALFVETSVSQRSIEAVLEGSRSRGHPVQLGGTLYSDALGAEHTPAGTYTGMVKANVQTIVNALR